LEEGKGEELVAGMVAEWEAGKAAEMVAGKEEELAKEKEVEWEAGMAAEMELAEAMESEESILEVAVEVVESDMAEEAHITSKLSISTRGRILTDSFSIYHFSSLLKYFKHILYYIVIIQLFIIFYLLLEYIFINF
jgi:hypothetical protein